jgi:hypothetical protein
MQTKQTIVEFATAEDLRKIRGSSPWTSNQQGSYTDSLLRPEYATRKLRFPVGKTWIRIVPSIRPSTYDWMIGVQAISYKDGRHAHPKTLGSGKSAFDQAYTWFSANKPEALFSKTNRDGYRLLTDPVSVFWVIVEESGRPVSRIFVGSGYDGSRGGVQGIGCQIYRMVKELDDEAHPLANPVDPENGVMISVDKTQPAGAKFASYSLRLGSNPSPMSDHISRMAEEELAVLCPLENTIRILSEDEEFERLAKIGIDPDTLSAIRSSVR